MNLEAERVEFPKWLDRWQFSRFITLAFNDTAYADARLPGTGGRAGEYCAQLGIRCDIGLIAASFAAESLERGKSFR